MKKLYILILLLALANFSQAQWIQLGSDIDGEAAEDYSGYSVSLSSDGLILAVGAIRNADNGENSGHVRLYEYSGGNWVQMGNDIDGEAPWDWFGTSVSLNSSGNIVAIGATANDDCFNGAGHVRIFEYVSGNWIQIGNNICGEAPFNNSGNPVSLNSDGLIVAIGAIGNSDNGNGSGHVRIYEYSGSNWVQKGGDIDGEVIMDHFGVSVSLSSDGSIVAIGARLNDGNGTSSGHVKIYEYTGVLWEQVGNNIEGEAADDNSGNSVSISSDGSVVAIGARQNDGNGSNAGHVRIYEYNGTNWIQKGTDIDGEANSDYSGEAVYLSSDGNAIVISAIGGDGIDVNSGFVKRYYFNGNDWLQIGNNIYGETVDDQSGSSVSLSSDGKIVAIGAIGNNGNGNNSGHVRIFNFCGTFDTLSVTECGSFLSPSGNYTWTNSGTYFDTIPNSVGCDSIITVYLTINNTYSIININECYNYTSPSGNYTWINSGIYSDTIPNSVGCDSIILINLTINNSTNTISSVECDSYLSPSGNYMWTSSGTYFDTIPNSVGCDSIITLNLNLNNSTNSTINQIVCDSFISPSGNFIWSSSGTYIDTIPNTIGCDSVITINLIVNNTSATINSISCNEYTSPSGNYIWTSSGTYQDTILNYVGCDSIITINLTINNSTNSIINTIACDSIISPSGNYIWTSSGTYQDTIPNFIGCDSIITINLTINNSTNSIINTIACDSIISPSGNYIWTSSGTYQDTISNAIGCDSVITISLIINNSTNSLISDTVCDSFISPSGNYTWTSSGTYQDTIINSFGCDSIFTIDLTIDNSGSFVSETLCDSLISPSGNYIWTISGIYQDTINTMFGCDSVITFDLEIGKSPFVNLGGDITITENQTVIIGSGFNLTSYLWNTGDTVPLIVVIGDSIGIGTHNYWLYSEGTNACSSTDTIIITVTPSIGVDDVENENGIKIYPNPTTGLITIKNEELRMNNVSVFDIYGKKVLETEVKSQKYELDLRKEAKGIYIIKVTTDKGVVVEKVVLE